MPVISKPGLTFYTNMPTPYQLDFFSALAKYFTLHVVYFTTREADRQWDLSVEGIEYSVTVLEDSPFAKLIQKKIPSFHYDVHLKSLIDQDNAPYIIVNGTYWTPNVILAIKNNFKKGRFVAFWSEPVFPVANALKFRFKRLLLSPVLNHTSCLLAIGANAEKSFKTYGYKKAIFQLPYNIDTRLFERVNLDQSKLSSLQQTHRDRSQFIFLTSGSLIYRKGMDTVINAFNAIPDSFNLKLLILGDGEEKLTLQELAKDNPNVEFLGFQEKNTVPYWFNLADAFVFASRYDGWGLVINEALAASKPIIASTSTGAAMDKLGNLNAILLEPEDTVGYTNAMIKISTNKELVQSFTKNSGSIREEVSSDFNANKLYDICTNS